MKDMLHTFSSNYSGVNWSAPDDATVEGEFSLAPLSLRYVNAKRRLHLHLTKVSALETWDTSEANVAVVRERSLSGQGELVEVVTTFELDGGPIRQFRYVKNIMIVPEPTQSDSGSCQQNDQAQAQVTEPEGVLFVEFEAYKIDGAHTNPALSLTITLDPTEFQRMFSLVRRRSEEIAGMTIILEAELFGDEPELNDGRSSEPIEYGMLRPADAPLAFVRVQLERMTVSFERSAVFYAEALPSTLLDTDHLKNGDLLNGPHSIIARRLGWVIALLALIALILLSGEDRSKWGKRYPRMLAANSQPLVLAVNFEKVAALDTRHQLVEAKNPHSGQPESTRLTTASSPSGKSFCDVASICSASHI